MSGERGRQMLRSTHFSGMIEACCTNRVRKYIDVSPIVIRFSLRNVLSHE